MSRYDNPQYAVPRRGQEDTNYARSQEVMRGQSLEVMRACHGGQNPRGGGGGGEEVHYASSHGYYAGVCLKEQSSSMTWFFRQSV